MKVGFVGLGKLGLPVALAVEAAGHEVAGYDVRMDDIADILTNEKAPYVEQGMDELLAKNQIELVQPDSLANWADLLFVAVQTPHQPEFEGVTRLTDERADFDYDYLREALRNVDNAKCPIVVISTVLPGTLGSLGATHVLYNPFFIAMGTTIPDFRNPEFVLVGTDGAPPGPLREFYATIHDRPVFVTTIKTAELTKVAYNTFIGLKIAFANAMMELCEKTGGDVDDLSDALGLAGKRIISTAYLRGGMGDGGGCHPRDNIALSWLAREVGLSFDLFGALMECREKQTDWIAAQVCLESAGWEAADRLPVEILGKAYKPETALTVGSPATLLANILTERGIVFEHTDPVVDA